MIKKDPRSANIQEDLKAIESVITKDADGIRTVVFNTVKGQLTRRIFNEGINSAGGAIGQYAVSTKKIRNKTGRRIDKVDLEMTGTLRRAIATGVGEGRVVLGLQEQPEPKISVADGRIKIGGTGELSTVENAILQEKHFQTEIFAPSKEELTRGEETLVKEINLRVKKALSRS